MRGVLSVSTDEGVLERKMVDELSMRAPAPGKSVPDTDAISLLDREATGMPPLTAEETAALERARAEHLADHRAFVGVRFPAWKAWALEQRCDP